MTLSNASLLANLDKNNSDDDDDGKQQVDCFEDASDTVGAVVDTATNVAVDHKKNEHLCLKKPNHEAGSDDDGRSEDRANFESDSDEEVYYALDPLQADDGQLDRRATSITNNHKLEFGEADARDLTVRLEETREILRMALSNEFVKALDLCSEK